MVDNNEFEEYKKTVQSIIDKYLPEGKKFSVKDFNKEQIWYVCRLLLEKDDEKRKKIWKEIDGKLNLSKYEYEKQYYEIMKNKELFDNYNNSTKDIDNLTDDIEAESKMDAYLDNI